MPKIARSSGSAHHRYQSCTSMPVSLAPSSHLAMQGYNTSNSRAQHMPLSTAFYPSTLTHPSPTPTPPPAPPYTRTQPYNNNQHHRHQQQQYTHMQATSAHAFTAAPLPPTTSNQPLTSQQPGNSHPPRRPAAGAWSPSDDRTLLRARQQGLNWSQLQSAYFALKTPNACRKRHERLLERRGRDGTGDESLDARRLECIARAYMAMRREIWQGLASRVGEKWTVVEARCMNSGLKNLQSHARCGARRERLEATGEHLPYASIRTNNKDDDSGIALSDVELSPIIDDMCGDDDLDAAHDGDEHEAGGDNGCEKGRGSAWGKSNEQEMDGNMQVSGGNGTINDGHDRATALDCESSAQISRHSWPQGDGVSHPTQFASSSVQDNHITTQCSHSNQSSTHPPHHGYMQSNINNNTSHNSSTYSSSLASSTGDAHAGSSSYTCTPAGQGVGASPRVYTAQGRSPMQRLGSAEMGIEAIINRTPLQHQQVHGGGVAVGV